MEDPANRPLTFLQSVMHSRGSQQDRDTFSGSCAPNSPSRQARALFLSIPLYGHIRPLLVQARTLARRGWDVCFASMDEARIFVEPMGVRFEGLGADPPGVPSTVEVFARATREPNFRKGSREILEWVHARWGSMYDGSLTLSRGWQPDLVIADMVTTSGIDVADVLGVPIVLNNANVLPMVSEALLPPAPTVPLMLTGRSRSEQSLADRMMYHPLRLLGVTIARRLARQTLDPIRAARGLPAADPIARAVGKRVLVNTVFGIEYERALPPEIYLVGPMLDDREPGLEPELSAWLSTGPPVVFVNLGTLAAPGAGFLTTLARGLEDASFRVLWVLRGDAAEIARRMSPGLRIEPWVSSQIAVLRHPAVRAFVSHCGVNSVHEAVISGVPIVGIPLFADQLDMAMRALDAGVALVLSKNALEADALRVAVKGVVNVSAFRRTMPALQAALAAAGGVERAADLLEDAAFCCRKSAMPNLRVLEQL
jgi:UDP:flavonoid glycosyltransferase YjiC (YdhE family)